MLIKNKQTPNSITSERILPRPTRKQVEGQTADHMCRDYNLDIEKKLQNMRYAN